MPSIDPNVTEHRLNVDPRHKPIIQKKHHMGSERAAAAYVEVQRLLDAGFIRERRMDLEYGAGDETKLDLENVCGLHGFE